MSSNYRIANGTDLDNVFEPGNSGLVCGFRIADGSDLGSRYSALTGLQAPLTKFRTSLGGGGPDYWDAAITTGNFVLSGNDRVATYTSGGTTNNSVVSVSPHATPQGKFYVEWVFTFSATGGTSTIHDLGMTRYPQVPVANSGLDLGVGIRRTGRTYVNGVWQTAPGETAITSGDTVMMAVDFNTSVAWIGLNGTWFSGNPATGTTPTIASFPTGTYRLFGSTANGLGAGYSIRPAATYPTPSGFTYWNQTAFYQEKFHLNTTGPNGSTVFTDTGPYNITVSNPGAVQIQSNAASFVAGGGLTAPDTSDAFSIPGDFYFSFYYTPNTTADGVIFCYGDFGTFNGTPSGQYLLSQSTGQFLNLFVSGINGGGASFVTAGPFTRNVEHFCEVQRIGNSWTIIVDKVLTAGGTSIQTTTIPTTTQTFNMGGATTGFPSTNGAIRALLLKRPAGSGLDLAEIFKKRIFPLALVAAPAAVSGSAPSGTATTNAATATASGGSAVYSTYSWVRTGGDASIVANTASAATTTFSRTVSAGTTYTATFTCTVTDSLAATATSNVVTVTLRGSGVSVSVSPTTLNRTATGTTATTTSVTATPSGGTGPYTYAWTRASGDTSITINSPTSAVTTFARSGIVPSTAYTATFGVVVTDSLAAASAPAFVTVTITGATPLSATVAPTSLTGTAPAGMTGTTGAASVSTTGGTAPLTFVWTFVSGDSSVRPDTPSASVSTFSRPLVVAGSTYVAVYKCVVTDSAANFDETANVTVTINGVSSLSVSASPTFVSVPAGNLVTTNTTATVTGGTGPYFYLWARTGGDANQSVSIPNNTATANFFDGRSGTSGEVDSTANFACTVTDSTGASATSNTVVSHVHTFGFTGGG